MLQTLVEDIKPSGAHVSITMRMLISFSQRNACNLYTSVMGNNLMASITDIAKITLDGVENSLSSIRDNNLLAYSSSQLMIANDTHETPTTVRLKPVSIGARIYIRIIAAINFFDCPDISSRSCQKKSIESSQQIRLYGYQSSYHRYFHGRNDDCKRCSRSTYP